MRIGPFVDGLIAGGENPSEYQVLCFNPATGETRYKPLKSVIRHDHDGPMYEIETGYGRRIRVTGEHSVFVANETGQPVLRRGDEVKPGDLLVAPSRLPNTVGAFERIDLLQSFVALRDKMDADVVLRGPAVVEWYKQRVRDDYAANPEMTEPRVTVPATIGELLKNKRHELGLSQEAVCTGVGIKQPVTFYAWESGKTRPTLSNFRRYAEVLGLDADALLPQVIVGESRLEHVWNTQYRGAPKNRVREYLTLTDLKPEDLRTLGDQVWLTPRHYADQAIPRYIPVDESLMLLLGFFVAEGALSTRNGLRLAIGKRNERVVEELERGRSGSLWDRTEPVHVR